MESKSVAIDGPSGAGKSTLAKMAAKKLGFIYVDTGALYRCIGLYAQRKHANPTDETAIAALLPEIKLEMYYDENGVQRMLLCSEDVTDEIRRPEVSKYASDVSALPVVRAYLLNMQREMAERYDVIMDGRDIGTVVLPNAGLKLFLSADAKVRGLRRHLELREKNVDVTLEEVMQDMSVRDKNDSTRAIAPLTKAPDAVCLDTTKLNLEESLTALCAIIGTRLKR